MIERVPDLPAGVLGFRATGKLTRDEFREIMKPIYETLDEGKQLNIYFELPGDFDGLDLGAIWQDMKAAGSVGLKHRTSWQKMALVTDKDWIRHAAAAFGWFAPGEFRLFPPEETAQAKAWVAKPASG